MAWFVSAKSNSQQRPRGRSEDAAAIAMHAARHIDRHAGCTTGVDCLDHIAHNTIEGPAKASTEQGIDHEFGVIDGLGVQLFDLALPHICCDGGISR